MNFFIFQTEFTFVLLLTWMQHSLTQYLAPPCHSPWACRCPFGTESYSGRNDCWTPGFTPVCPPVDQRCLDMCPFGPVNDEYGCTRCLCNDPRRCPRHDCFPNPPCLNGFERDSRGCHTCKCINPACPVLRCPANCPNGFMSMTDSNGCQTCKCQENHFCPPFRCQLKCRYGFRSNNGCKICRCKARPNRQRNCPQITCPYCPNGLSYMRNRAGCQTCMCKSERLPVTPDCTGFTCSFYCQLPRRYFSRIKSCQCNCESNGRLLSF